MVPDAVVAMDALPVTTSGKIDRKRLPEPVFEKSSADDAPATLAEEQLVEIWADDAKLAPYQIPVTRSFFELGGHSLLIMMLIARIQADVQRAADRRRRVRAADGARSRRADRRARARGDRPDPEGRPSATIIR